MTNSTNTGLIDNPTSRCACMLVLDVSYSMNGEKIAELNEGVQQFLDEVRKDDFARYSVELGVITFGGKVTRKIPFGPLDNLQWEDLEVAGNTPMGGAINAAIDDVEDRKKEYTKAGVSYYQPWLVIMTDGVPTDSYSSAAKRLKKMAEEKKIVVFGIGIGDECDMSKLAEFCPDDRLPAKLDGFKFKEFFAWLSQSMSRVSQSTPGAENVEIELVSPASWMSIKT